MVRPRGLANPKSGNKEILRVRRKVSPYPSIQGTIKEGYVRREKGANVVLPKRKSGRSFRLLKNDLSTNSD
jgi:hypothetical protein